MSDISGLSFGGNVWSYGSVDAFKADFEAAQKAQGGAVGSDKTSATGKPKKAQKEPEDTGLTRYLGTTGSAEQKLANLYKISKFVDDFRLNSKNGDLPETQELRKLKNTLSPDDLAKKILGGPDGVDKTGKILARMLGEKTLAARQKVKGQENSTLSDAEQKNIERACSTALTKTFQAYSLDRLSRLMSNGDPVNLAKADKDVLLNTALGAAELLMDGRITGDSVVTLLRDGSLLDLANTLDVTVLLHRAAAQAKEQFTQKAALLKAAADGTPQDQKAIHELLAVREKFAKVLDFQIHEHDPAGKLDDEKFLPKQLQEVKLRLQQFRYDLERCKGEVGKEFGHGKYSFYGVMEKLRRACSNLKGDRHLDVRFKTNAERKQAYAELEKAERDVPTKLSALLQNRLKNVLAEELAKRVETACTTTHDANDVARMSQVTASDRREEDVYAGKVLDLLRKTGGMQMVSTEISVAAVAQIGTPAPVAGQVSVGGFYKTYAGITAIKDGGYSLVLSKSGGARVEAEADAAGVASAKAGAEGGGGKETVLSFGSREELLAYCRQNCPKLMESIPGSITDIKDRDLLDEEKFSGIKSTVEWTGMVVKVAKFIGNVTGLRIHKTKYFSEANFENRVRQDGTFGRLDAILYRRRNGLATSRTQVSTKSGKVDVSAGVDLGTDAVGVALEAGASVGGATKAARTKVLKTAGAIAEMHTAGEMRKTLLRDEFQAYRDYQETAPAKYRDGSFASELEALVNSEPKQGASVEERAKFWSGMLADIARRHKALEGEYSAPNTSKNVFRVKKDTRALQVDFARKTRLSAIVNEYVAKRIESELATATSPSVKASLRTALKFSRESLGVTLAHSNIVLASDVVQQHLQFGREFSAGKSREFEAQVSVGWDVGVRESSGGDSSDAATNGATNAAVALFKESFMSAAGALKEDVEKALKSLLGLSGKVKASLTSKTYADRGDTVEPWANTNALKITLDVTRPLGPLSLIESVVKLVEKAKTEKPGDGKWAQTLGQVSKEFAVELGKQMGATALAEADKVGTALVEQAAMLPVRILLGGVNKAMERMGVALGFESSDTTDKGATLVLTFKDGKLTQCKMSDYVSSESSIKLSAKAASLPVGVSFGKTDVQRRERVTFDSMPHATLGTVLSRADEILRAEGFLRTDASVVAKFKDFLLKNQKSVNELVRDLRRTLESGRPVYENRSLQAIRDGLENLTALAGAGGGKVPVKMKRAAKAAYAAALKNWSELVTAPPASEKEPASTELMVKLSKSLLEAYDLLASAQQLGWRATKG